MNRRIFVVATMVCGMTACAFKGNPELHEHYQEMDLIRLTSKEGIRKKKDIIYENYSGHYLNGKIKNRLKNESISNQAIFLIYCLHKYEAYKFDGEISYEFKELFVEPFGFKIVAIKAYSIMNDINKPMNFSDFESTEIRRWLKNHMR